MIVCTWCGNEMADVESNQNSELDYNEIFDYFYRKVPIAQNDLYFCNAGCQDKFEEEIRDIELSNGQCKCTKCSQILNWDWICRECHICFECSYEDVIDMSARCTSWPNLCRYCCACDKCIDCDTCLLSRGGNLGTGRYGQYIENVGWKCLPEHLCKKITEL